MTPVEIIAIVAVTLIVGGAVAYIIKSKLSGKKCIGCPSAHQCSGQCAGCTQSCGTCKK